MSNKRTILTDVEIFYIRENPLDLTKKELADKFNIAMSAVHNVYTNGKKLVNRQPTVEEVEVVPEPVRPKGNETLKKSILNKTDGSRNKPEGRGGIAVLGETASELIDEANKQARGRVRNNKAQTSYTAKTYPERE